MLNELFAAAIPPIVDEHGGEVDRLLGDAIMATWERRRYGRFAAPASRHSGKSP
jgi:class 3 adenylate cyclase